MSTQVFTNINGMVQHRHPGAKGWGNKNWHDPAKKHDALHTVNKADEPTNASLLNATQLKQYQQALAGKSFYGRNLELSAIRRGLPEGVLHETRQSDDDGIDAAKVAAEAEAKALFDKAEYGILDQ